LTVLVAPEAESQTALAAQVRVAEVVAAHVHAAAGDDRVAGGAVGLDPAGLLGFLQRVRAGASLEAVTAVGAGHHADVHPVDQDVPAGQALITRVTDPVGVVVLPLHAAEDDVLEVGEVVVLGLQAAGDDDGGARLGRHGPAGGRVLADGVGPRPHVV